MNKICGTTYISICKSLALFVAPADDVTLTDNISQALIVFVSGLFSSNVLDVVISCAEVNKLVAHLYTFQAQAAQAQAAAVFTNEFTGNKYASYGIR